MSSPSIKKNFILSTLYQILTLLTPFITAPYVSRVLGADGIGINSYTNSVQMYFSLFATLGTASYGAREIAMARDDLERRTLLFWEIEILSIFTSFVCLIGWGFLVFFSDQYRIFYLVLTFSLLSTMFDISWFFTGLEQFKYIVARNAFFKIFGIVLLFMLVKKREDLVLFMLINVLSGLIGTLSIWFYLPKFITKVNIKKLRPFKHLRHSFIYFIPTIATSIYTILDKTLIGLITHNEEQNGFYEQATKIINMVKAITFSSLNMVLEPRMAYLFTEKKDDEIKNKIEKSINYILFMGIGCWLGLEGVSSTFVPVFFGPGYEPVILAIRLLSPIVIIIGISNCIGSLYYTPAGFRKKSANFLIVGSCINLCLNLILIPQLGSYGAILGSLAAETAITVLYILFCHGYMTFKKICILAIKKLIAGIVMLLLLLELETLINNAGLRLFCQIFVGACAYCTMLVLLKDSFISKFALPQIKKHFQQKRND